MEGLGILDFLIHCKFLNRKKAIDMGFEMKLNIMVIKGEIVKVN